MRGDCGDARALGSSVLTESVAATHFVQFFQADEPSLVDNVAEYIAQAFVRGECALVIAVEQHRHAFGRRLQALGAKGQILFLDAAETLARFMVNGSPDEQLFGEVLADAVKQVSHGVAGIGVRAYGEMVGILWQRGDIAAAIELEALWNRELESRGFALFCGYPIDIFDPEFQMADMDAVLCAHTHLLPTCRGGSLETSVNRALQEVYGSKLQGLRQLMNSNFRLGWAAVPNGEAIILWLRRNLPESAAEVLGRARIHYNRMGSGLEN